MAANKDKEMYKCDNCKRIVYMMETGKGDQLKCCDNEMREMNEKEKEPYHPQFIRPGAP